MSCEIFRQFALDQNWDPATRRRAAQTLQHLETCAECQTAISDYDRLRQTLGAFAADVDPPAGWEVFTQQRKMLASGAATATLAPKPTVISRYPSRWRIAWTAIAASIFLAASVAFEFGQAAARPVVFDRPGGFVAADRAFSPSELPRELDNFSQLSNFYNGRIGWMLATKSTTDFGIVPEQPLAAQNILLLRLTVTNGPQLTSNADLLIIPGQTANMTIPADHGPALHYRVGTSAYDPSHISISLELNSSGADDVPAALATNLQLQPGEKLTAGRLVTAHGEYELKVSFAYAGLTQNQKSEYPKSEQNQNDQ